MDANVAPELTSRVKSIALGVKGVREVHKLKLRRSGPFVLGETDIGVSSTLHINKAHKIADKVESAVKAKLPEIDSLLIHLEPSLLGQIRIAIPVDKYKGMDSEFAGRFGTSKTFLFIDADDGKVVTTFSEQNPSKKLQKGRGIETAKFLNKHNVDVLISQRMGEGPFNILRSEDVIIHRGIAGSVSHNLASFFEGRLKRVKPLRRR